MEFFNYIILFFILISSFFVVSSRNPIHSVLCLVSVFLFSAAILLLLEVEFLAFSFIIVYVGAIAILFLFVLMMIDIKIGDPLPLPFTFFSIILFISCLYGTLLPVLNSLSSYQYTAFRSKFTFVDWLGMVDSLSNTEAVGQVLYTYYFVFLLIAGLVLFVSMLGAIMLTLRLTNNADYQDLTKQLSRDPGQSVKVS
jgi:NADH-quinone oxidoreductase subunit J